MATFFNKGSLPAALPLVSYSPPRLSIHPTQQQEHALFTLKDEDDRDICAYLRFAASSGSGLQPSNDHAALPKEKVRAIEALKNCPVDVLLAWLQTSRHSGSHSAVSPATVPDHVHSSSSEDSRHDPLDIASNTWSRSGNLPQVIPRWYSCTVCPGLRSFQNAAEWKRHEKEHEVLYRCGLCSATESENEQVATLQEAKVHSKIYTCRRRGLMVDHLSRDHAKHDKTQGRRMAESWRVNSGKQAWSCGFCARLFSAFGDRLKHIDNEHFKMHHHIRDWDRSKVILGLLLQPGVKEAWENLVALKSLHDSSGLSWEDPALNELQLLLEKGPSNGQSALSLAAAAYAVVRPRPSLNQLATTSFDGAVDSSSKYSNTLNHLDGIAIPLSSHTAGFQQPALSHDPMLDGSDLQDFSTTGQDYAPAPTFGGAENVFFSPFNPS